MKLYFVVLLKSDLEFQQNRTTIMAMTTIIFVLSGARDVFVEHLSPT